MALTDGAIEALSGAVERLDARSSKLPDGPQRRLFLQAIAEHAELESLRQRISADRAWIAGPN